MSTPSMEKHQVAVSFGDGKIIVHRVASNISKRFEMVRDSELDDMNRVVVRCRQIEKQPDDMRLSAPAMRPREVVYEIPAEDADCHHIVIV